MHLQVYVSIYSDDKGKRRAMDNLQRLEPWVMPLQHVSCHLHVPTVARVHCMHAGAADACCRKGPCLTVHASIDRG